MNNAEIRAILDNVRYLDFTFRAEPIGDSHILYIEHTEEDHITGWPRPMQGRRWFIQAGMTKDDLVRTCLVAVLAWQEHEIRETFKYRGAAIFDPHFSVDEAAESARHYEGHE